MTFANTPQGLEEGPTEKAWRLGESLRHRTTRQFIVRKWWHTPLVSLYFMAIGLIFLGDSLIIVSLFPWDDSFHWEKLKILLIASSHGFFGISFFVVAVAAWTDPYALTLDGNGGLILQSVVRARRIPIEDIKAVVLARQQNGEENTDAPDICFKLSRGKLKLPRFAERDKFLKVLEAAHPALVVETV